MAFGYMTPGNNATGRPLQPVGRTLRRATLLAAVVALVSVAPQAQATLFGRIFGEHITGSGTLVQQTLEPDHFTGVSLQLPATVELRQGTADRVTIETDDNILPQIETEVQDLTLRIRPRNSTTQLETKHLKIIIEARKIKALEIGGDVSLHASALRTSELYVTVGGASQVVFDRLDSGTLTLAMGGSGRFVAKGVVRDLSVSLGGIGVIDAAELKTDQASINVGGLGRVTVAVRNSLDINLAGPARVGYYGNPKITEALVGGASVTRLGGLPN